MKKYNVKLNVVIVTIISICLLTVNSYAHSGRTDSNGGHKDKNNVSGLGSYHYHCGGHPAHLHPNGVCPYSSSSVSSKAINNIQSTVDVTLILIDQSSTNIDVGNKMTLTATIYPNDASNKNITWKSSDENIATITSTGELIAKKAGVVDITVTASNGKSSTIKINIQEKVKAETSNSISKNNEINENSLDYEQEELSEWSNIATLSILGGVGYIVYKKIRKNNL